MKKESRDAAAAVATPSPPLLFLPPPRPNGLTASAFSAKHPRDPHEPHDRRKPAAKEHSIQRSAKRLVHGCEKFIPALA